MLNMLSRYLGLMTLLVLFTATAQAKFDIDMNQLHGIEPRNIGPAGTSGRVTAITVSPINDQQIYAGTASGGLWRSNNNGTTWEALFQDQKIMSIGSLAVNPKNPDEIWLGTGEGNPRNSQSSGYGVYKSLDAGRTWQHMGLEKTRNIHRLLIDPNNPKRIYVGAQGSAWGDSEHRGVYRSDDSGASWKQILFTNNQTGVADMVMDPVNPNKLMVAMWQFRRWPWFFKSGGEGSALYISYNGGDDFSQIKSGSGLPDGELGRIGLAIAPSQPQRVYALVESKNNALYRSDDGGHHWQKMAVHNQGNRPFYYSDLFVDPKNENRVYSIWTLVSKSEDGGKSFDIIAGFPGSVHPDHHSWWINPKNPKHFLIGNDGGIASTHDQGNSWNFIKNLPISQFYHVAVDNELPYNVYGGMQDNGSWYAPAYAWRDNGLLNSYWEMTSFGDGFDVISDPSDARYGYSMSQGGMLGRYDKLDRSHSLIRPVHPEGKVLRFNWNAAIGLDPIDNKTLYIGSQYVHKSADQGLSWQIISPDLTTNDPEKQKQTETGGITRDATGAENHTSLTVISPSPVKQGVIWAGSDDGLIHVSKDGGAKWKKAAKLRGVPAGSWIAQIKASSYTESEAFAVVNNYRRDDWTPWVFHTKNFGKSWKRIVDTKDVFGYALSFVQDIVEPNLMFLGTEGGLYVSFNGAKDWHQWSDSYPHVSTMDMVIQPREHDLVIGTFGRSLFVIDDIRPLRLIAQTKGDVFKEPLQMASIPDAYLAYFGWSRGIIMVDDGSFSGDNRNKGAMISVFADIKALAKSSEMKDSKDKSARTKHKQEKEVNAIVEVFDSKNKRVRKTEVTIKAGLNRFNWGLTADGARYPGMPKPEIDDTKPEGFLVPPGQYKVKLIVNDDSTEQLVNVKLDPRNQTQSKHIAEKQLLLERYLQLNNQLVQVIDYLDAADSEIEQLSALRQERKFDQDNESQWQEKEKDLKAKIKALRERILSPKDIAGYTDYPDLLGQKMGELSWFLQSGNQWKPATQTQKLLMTQLERQAKPILESINQFFSGPYANYQKSMQSIEWLNQYELLN
jgi:photosystem II stability/assembly factor-like uncharacterized protein